MTASKESPGAERPSACSDSRRCFLQKRYLLSWILAAILPFILLRLLFVSEVAFPYHSEPVSSLGMALQPELKLPDEEQKPAEQVDKEEDRPQHQREEHEETKLPEEGQESVKQAGKEEDKPQQQQEEQEVKPLEQVDKEEDKSQQQGKEHDETGLPRFAEEGQKPLEQVDKDEDKPQLQQEKHEETKPPENPVDKQKPVEQVNKEEDKLQQQREEHEETLPKLPEEEQGHKEEDGAQQEKPAGACDLFEGDWEHDPEGPLYTNSTCSFIERQNCLSNGRPDTEYLYWRWKPRDCDLPRFDAKLFLDKFRGKGIAFIGDSIARNQMQSLLCMLSQVETPVLTEQSNAAKYKGYLFKEHQFRLEVIWAPYLVNYSQDGGNVVLGKDQVIVHLDVLDPVWTSVMQEFDILVFSSGPWYSRDSMYLKQQEVVGCHHCPAFNLTELTELSYYDVYRGAIRQVLEKVSGDGFKGVAIMNTFSVSHFEVGQWFDGGECKRTLPLQSEESAQVAGEHYKMRDILFEEFNGIVELNREARKDKRVEILDVTKVSIQRADGHPGPFRWLHWDPAVRRYHDCLHWCLPGPIDAWNEVLDRLLDKYFR